MKSYWYIIFLLVLLFLQLGFAQTASYVAISDTTVQVGSEAVVLKAGQPVQVMQLSDGKAMISVKLSDGSSGVTQIDASILQVSSSPGPSSNPAAPAPISTPIPQPVRTPPPTPKPSANPDNGEEGKPFTFDSTIPIDPNGNFSHAQFRFWVPPYKNSIRGIIVLSPGTDGDARGQVNDRSWQTFAKKYRMALIGTFFKSQPNCDYTDAMYGSGKALLAAITEFTGDLKTHPELDQAPMLMYGISAGGEFDYNFAMWKPERTISFVVNKGAYYNQSTASPDGRAIPGLFFLGLKDEKYRIDGITSIWTRGRRAGALWALAPQPNSGHEFSKTAPVAQVFFDAVVKARLPDDSNLISLGTDAPVLKPMDESHGWQGNLTTFEIKDASMSSLDDSSDLSWFPDQLSAEAWKKFVNPGAK